MHKIAAALHGAAVGGAADDADDAAEMRGASDGNRWSMRLLGTFVDSRGHKNYRVMTQDAVSSAMHVRVYKDVELKVALKEVRPDGKTETQDKPRHEKPLTLEDGRRFFLNLMAICTLGLALALGYSCVSQYTALRHGTSCESFQNS